MQNNNYSRCIEIYVYIQGGCFQDLCVIYSSLRQSLVCFDNLWDTLCPRFGLFINYHENTSTLTHSSRSSCAVNKVNRCLWNIIQYDVSQTLEV